MAFQIVFKRYEIKYMLTQKIKNFLTLQLRRDKVFV